MTAPRHIAEATDYLSFIAALRARVDQLGISYATVDQIAGLADTHTTKLLCPEPLKTFGPMSFDAILGALAVKIIIVEDPKRIDRVRRNSHFAPKKVPSTWPMRALGKHDYIVHRFTRENTRLGAIRGGKARAQKLSAKRRTIIARRAARIRWRKARAQRAK